MRVNQLDTQYQGFIELFQTDSGNLPLKTAYIELNRLFISTENNELMLRLNAYTKTLVVARVLFNQQRQGNGTKLLMLLHTYAKQQGYAQIQFESVLTEEMQSF